MKTMKTMGVWIVVTGFAALIAVSGNTLARDLDDIPGAEDSSASARSSRMDDRRIDDRRMDDVDASARSLRQVKVILLESDSCREGITAGLGERGYSVTTEPGRVDAVLDVDVKTTGRNLDNIPEFGGIGKKASYSATLRGTNDKVLFSTSGHEGSVNTAELCGDIGDDIGDRLKAQKSG